MKKIILGSGSPRRKELLASLDIQFEIRTKVTDESCPDEIPPKDHALYIAWRKVNELRSELTDDDILICADTVVIVDGIVMNKPVSHEGAFDMLSKLSGKMHEVATGIVVCTKDQHLEQTVVTKVEFNEIPVSAIEYYIKTYKPYDKAGAYGIQEWIGYAFVKKIEGSYNNVVGLPTAEIYSMISCILNS